MKQTTKKIKKQNDSFQKLSFLKTNVFFILFVISLTIVNNDPLLTIVNDDPFLTIVK